MARVAGQLLFAVLLLCIHGGMYGSLQLAPRSNALGNADIFGYVRIARVLGEFSTGEKGRTQKLVMVFTSDPRQEPGMFGPGWRLPLFDSLVVEYEQTKLFWDAPNEQRYFFKADSSIATGTGERGYRHLSGRWNALVKRNGEIVITGASDALTPSCTAMES
jgi:hypothetical protein